MKLSSFTVYGIAIIIWFVVAVVGFTFIVNIVFKSYPKATFELVSAIDTIISVILGFNVIAIAEAINSKLNISKTLNFSKFEVMYKDYVNNYRNEHKNSFSNLFKEASLLSVAKPGRCIIYWFLKKYK